MTVREAIDWVDEKKHNVYSGEDKLQWLSQVEAMAERLESRYDGFRPGRELGMESVLRIPAPFDQLYLRWLEGQIDYANQEYLKYNNAMTLFNSLWTEYANWYVRSHVHGGIRRFAPGGKA